MQVNALTTSGMPPNRTGSATTVRNDLRFRAHPQTVSLLFAGRQRKIMSYNVENFYRTPDYQKKPESLAALAQVILQEDPDVIAFQEVGDRELLQAFNTVMLKGRYPNVVSFPTSQQPGIRTAIMSKSNIRVVEQKSHWNEMTGGNPANHWKRDFQEATFETETGFRFTIFNGHFKSMNGGEEATMPTRLHEATVAARVVRERLEREPDHPVFVMGDFNTLHDSPHGKPVLDTLSLKTDDNPANDMTEVFLKDGQAAPTHCWSDRYTRSKLDYVFASPGMLPLVQQASVVGRFRKYPWKLASDHLPSTVVIEEPDKQKPDKQKAGKRPRQAQSPKFGVKMLPLPGQRLQVTA